MRLPGHVVVTTTDATDAPDFSAWVAAREPALLRTAWLLTGDEATAEDLVQASLERCWRHWGRVCRADDMQAYVRRVLVTTHASRQRRRWLGEIPTADLPDSPTPVDSLDAVLARPVLVAALARLPRGQRAVVVLRFAEDLSEAQTAELLGCSVGTVKSQTARALKSLRGVLSEHQEEPR